MGVRTYGAVNGTRVYVDQDGPLADFEAGAAKLTLHPKEAKLVRGIYESLPVVEGSQEALQELITLGFEVFVLTKTSGKNPYAATEKILWLNKHFPFLEDRIIITPDKGCMGTAVDILIDDHPEWANADKFPGKIITFQPATDNIYFYKTNDWGKIVDACSYWNKVFNTVVYAG